MLSALGFPSTLPSTTLGPPRFPTGKSLPRLPSPPPDGVPNMRLAAFKEKFPGNRGAADVSDTAGPLFKAGRRLVVEAPMDTATLDRTATLERA